MQELLATGSGRTTICEVVIKASDQTYLEIEPYSPQDMESMILDFCDSLSDPADVQGEQKVMLSKEIETAIRNVINSTRCPSRIRKGKSLRRNESTGREGMEKSGLDGLRG